MSRGSLVADSDHLMEFEAWTRQKQSLNVLQMLQNCDFWTTDYE
jgi:hypothetical protein